MNVPHDLGFPMSAKTFEEREAKEYHRDPKDSNSEGLSTLRIRNQLVTVEDRTGHRDLPLMHILRLVAPGLTLLKDNR